MAIYALFANISARSGLTAPFSTQWSKIDSINLGFMRPINRTSSSYAVGVLQVEPIQLNKMIDGASVQLSKNALFGSLLPNVNIAITEGTSNKTVVAFKLSSVYIGQNQSGAETTNPAHEVLTLSYAQIAMSVLTAGTIETVSWDLVANTGGTGSGPFTLDPTWGIRIA